MLEMFEGANKHKGSIMDYAEKNLSERVRVCLEMKDTHPLKEP